MTGSSSLNKATNQEEALVKFAGRLQNRCVGYQTLHIHMSKLQPHNRTEAVMRIAESLMRRVVTTYDDQMFRLSNDDLILICRGKQVEDVFSLLDQIRALVKKDPLLAGEDGAAALATWNDLSVTWREFMGRCELLLDERISASDKDESAAKEEEKPLDPLDAARLGRLEASLKAVDMSNFIRRQPICALAADAPPQPILDEIYVSVADLRRAIMPNVDLKANPFLFRQLTNTFDSRLLAALTKSSSGKLSRSISINLNVSTILSPEFLQFVDKIGPRGEHALVVEVEAGDAFANLKEFLLARDVSREVGYRLCLDGLSCVALPFIDFKRFGCDFYKMVWDSDIDNLQDGARADIDEAVKRASAHRIILSRCDQAHAVEFGRSLGVTLYQGWHIDSRLRARMA